jgi:hypothetical protein
MQRGDPPQHRARVVIVSQRARGNADGRQASSTTLSLVPRWSTERAVEMAAQAFKQADRKGPPGA